jgi:chemotaxis protein CheX
MQTAPPNIAPMIDAVARDVIGTMTGLVIESSEQDPVPRPFTVNGVAGVVGLADGLAANIHFVMTDAAARRLVGAMIGSVEFGDADLRDAVGELTNMIAGGLKNRLDHAGIPLRLTVPTFIRGLETQITAKGFTFGSTNVFRLAGVADPVKVVVFARMSP